MKREIPSGLKGMWLFVIFDLPVKMAEQRKEYSIFRKRLLSQGFTMLQYSVYAKYTSSRENCDNLTQRIKKIIPPEGEVRLIYLTDRQFSDMQVFYGKVKKNPETPPEQFLFF